MVDGPLTIESLATGPLVITHQVSGLSLVQTSVSGDARNVAVVAILSGTKIVWSETLTQDLPDFTIPFDVDGGDVCYQQPTSLSLTVPTENQIGSVLMSTTFTRPYQKPQPFSAYVATWPLDSRTPLPTFAFVPRPLKKQPKWLHCL